MLFSRSRKLERDMKRASSYEEWQDAATAWDEHNGFHRWKLMDPSRRYDYVSIRIRLDRLRALRARHDHHGLLFTLNEGLHGNMGGMGKAALYQKAKSGTKQLIGDYVEEVISALEHLASAEVDDINFEDKLDFYRRAHHCFGRSALMMSGSGSLMYFHVGVAKTLWAQGLLPDILSGSSGGAFVSSLFSAHSDDELKNLFDPENLANDLGPEHGVLGRIKSLKPRMMRIDEIQQYIARLIPDLTFQEALERTGRQMNVSIAPAEIHQTSRLLNATTSPNVFIREAILASAAAPGIFPPVILAAKNSLGERQAYLPSRKWVDGSISDDLPAKRLARLYGVNHYIVSQTNPHVIPFVTDSNREQDMLSVLRYAAIGTARTWANAGATIAHKPLLRRPRLKQVTDTVMSVINQDYVGDINILPPSKFHNPLKLLAHRSTEEIRELIAMGEKSTWPKVEMIRIQTRISRVLDRILADFEQQRVNGGRTGCS